MMVMIRYQHKEENEGEGERERNEGRMANASKEESFLLTVTSINEMGRVKRERMKRCCTTCRRVVFPLISFHGSSRTRIKIPRVRGKRRVTFQRFDESYIFKSDLSFLLPSNGMNSKEKREAFQSD